MPSINSRHGEIRHFYKNPVTGEFEPMEVIKHIDINIGEPPRYSEGPCVTKTINVRVDGLETYEQVKDLIGYVHNLWEKSNG